MFDRVLHIPTGKPCFIIEILDEGTTSESIGLEVEDQDDEDWFYWAKEQDLEKLPEHK